MSKENNIELKKEYYKNKHGIHLAEYLERLRCGAYYIAEASHLFNAIKYRVRAGKKPKVDAEDDYSKADDYIGRLQKTFYRDYTVEEVSDHVNNMIKDFETYTGTE